MFTDQLAHVRQRIHQACLRSQRHPSDVTLLGVTKGVPAAVIEDALAHGLTDLGENRVQEAREKRTVLQPNPSVRWHLIGHLQRNKVKLAVDLFDMIHSVDSHALAEVLEHQLAMQGHTKPILVQVNVSGEATKFGCAPDDVVPLARAIARMPHLELHGLMTMAPLQDDPEAARPYFHRLRQLRDEVAMAFTRDPQTLKLSMGMSHDFEVAIEEGASYVRVGTLLFGPRV